MADLTGHTLGRYKVTGKLGEGGMATVYQAYDTRLDADVAVKVIHTENISRGGMDHAMKRFEREAKTLAKLTHPNIVKVIDYGQYQGQPYLVMTYLVGGTLKDRLGQPMPWRTAARLLTPIARALEYAHQQGMIHRDVKPSNILITGSGEPMLTDFGIAKIINEEAGMELTGTNATMGTPEYMAPEQVTSKNIDHRADIYSLGVVFYEMVTGGRPFKADTPMGVLLKQASEPIPMPGIFVKDLPTEVEKVLLKALAKKADDRYDNAGAFAEALEQLTSGGPPTGPIPPMAATSSKPAVPVQPTMYEDLSQTFLAPPVLPDVSRQAYPIPDAIPTRRPAGRSKTRYILGALLGVVLLGLCLLGGGVLYATDGFGVFTAPTIAAPTPTVTPIPFLSGDPKAWIPGTLLIPPEMEIVKEGTNTNEEVAANYDNPAEWLTYLNEIGRETGYFISYRNRAGCSLSSGLTYISLNPIRMRDLSASLVYINQILLDAQKKAGRSLRWVDGIGERAFIEEWTYQDTCDPKHTHHAITIRFARYNGLVGVSVYVLSDQMTREHLYSLAANYAQLIDNHMIFLAMP